MEGQRVTRSGRVAVAGTAQRERWQPAAKTSTVNENESVNQEKQVASASMNCVTSVQLSSDAYKLDKLSSSFLFTEKNWNSAAICA